MREFVRSHLAIVRDKGLAWQINVAWKTIAIIAVLVSAAHFLSQNVSHKAFDRHGLAQLAAKGSLPARDRARSR